MLLLNWRTALGTVLCAVTYSLSCLAQVAPPAILKIEYENGVRYVYDTVDIPAFATVPTPTSQAAPTFATYVLLADVVAVNGKPAKGIFLTRQIVVNLTTNPSAGQAIADLARTNVVDRIPLQEVNSPVDVLVNGQAAEVVNKVGWPGFENVYRVDFRVPEGTAAGMATLQLSAAWIPGSPVNIQIQ
jgi:uncharacterized protein (TIGR03437 family)